MKALIIYSSRDGQTEKIAKAIANRIQHAQLCDMINLNHNESVNWEQYNKVLIGAPVRYGHFPKVLHQFILNNIEPLQQRTSAFFSVNLTARKKEKCTAEDNAYTRKFLQTSPWKPDDCAVFAGALRYPRYRWFDRIMIQLIMRMTGGVTDTNQEVEYTDWTKVDEFADQFIQLAIKND